MTIEKFEDIIAWQKAKGLTIDDFNRFYNLSLEISKLLSGFIKALDK